MTDVHKALYAFWSSFKRHTERGWEDVPAYLQGHVPMTIDEDGEETPVDPPYITFEVASGAAMSAAYLTAISWHKATLDGGNVNLERARLLDAIAKAIPESGRKLTLEGGGFVMLYRGEDTWQTAYDDPEDPAVIGGRTAYRAVFYTQ